MKKAAMLLLMILAFSPSAARAQKVEIALCSSSSTAARTPSKAEADRRALQRQRPKAWVGGVVAGGDEHHLVTEVEN